MGFFDSWRSLFTPPAVPALPTAPIVRRVDSAPSGPIPGGASRRHDSLLLPYGGGSSIAVGAASNCELYEMELTPDQLRYAYARNGIVRRIVRLLPERAIWKGWSVPDLTEIDRQLRIYPAVGDAMTLARLYGDSPLLMVTMDDVPRQWRNRPQEWLAQPLDLERVGQLVAVQPFDAYMAQPAEYERNPASPNFRLPSMWWLTIDGYQFRVHASRVSLFRGARRPPSEMQGGWGSFSGLPDASVVQAIWTDIRRLRTTWAAGADMAESLKYSVLKLAQLAEFATGNEGALLVERMQLIQGLQDSFGFTVVGPGDEYETRNTPPTGISELSNTQLSALATVLGWPVTMLAGEAPGGLSPADTAGLERERQIVSAYQEDNREPIEAIYAVAYAAQDGETRGQTPESWSVEFRALTEPTAKETADVRLVYAQMDAINVGMGVYGPEHVAEARFGPDGFSTEMIAVPIPDPADLEQEAALQAEVDRLTAEADDAEPDAGSGVEE